MIAELLVAVGAGALVLALRPRAPGGSSRYGLVTHPVHVVARRPLGGGWHGFLLRVDGGPWQGWYAVRALGYSDELVVGGGGFDTEAEALEAYADLAEP